MPEPGEAEAAVAEPEQAGPPAAPRRTARRSRAALLAAVAALVLALDATSKALIVAKLTPGVPVHVIGDELTWDLVRNSGAAFSLGTGYTVIFTLLAIGVIAFVIRTARRLRSTGYAVAFGLLLGGAAGNLADRLLRAPGVFRGNVVDWIDVAHYPAVFNLADSAICVSAALFVILVARGARVDGTPGPRDDAGPGDDNGPRDADQ
jgi:signal peptidase II